VAFAFVLVKPGAHGARRAKADALAQAHFAEDAQGWAALRTDATQVCCRQ